MSIWLMVMVLGLLASSCVAEKRLASAKSPNGRMEVAVWEWKFPVDSKIMITLDSGSAVRTVLKDPTDRGPEVVQIAWTNDSKMFGVVVFDKFAPNLIFAYDVNENRQVDPGLIMDSLHRALIERYGLRQDAESDPSFDPVKWLTRQLNTGKIPDRR